jgi:hypothetical protein
MLVGMVALCSACMSDDAAFLKEPTTVNYVVDINRSASADGRLRFTDGSIKIAALEFEGRRDEGSDVYFANTYEPALHLMFDPSEIIADLRAQIPQGTYTFIELELETSDQNDEAGLVLIGSYLRTNGQTYPLRLEIAAGLLVELDAQTLQGAGPIVLEQNRIATAKIFFDPIALMAAVPAASLENAQLTTREDEEGNEEAYILINEEVNETIYEIALTRIEIASSVIFD